MKVADIVTFDLETGGLKKEDAGLAEIAMIVFDSDTLKEIDRYEAIIAPYEQPSGQMSTYHPKALEVNGLTMKQINAGKDAKTVAKEIKEFCKKHAKKLRGGNGKLIPGGHNIVKFDLPWLEYFLELNKVKMDDCFNNLVIDTLLWTRLIWAKDGSIADHKLGTACQQVGVQLIDAHRAMNDVEGNADLIRNILRRMRQEGSVVEKKKVKFRKKFVF